GRSFRGGFAPMERGAGTSGMRGGILLVRCLKHLAPVRPIVDRRIVFGTGTVVSRMAHHYNGHHGTFEACPRCQWEPAARWEQGASFGVLVTDGPRVVEVSETARSSWCRSGGVSDSPSAPQRGRLPPVLAESSRKVLLPLWIGVETLSTFGSFIGTRTSIRYQVVSNEHAFFDSSEGLSLGLSAALDGLHPGTGPPRGGPDSERTARGSEPRQGDHPASCPEKDLGELYQRFGRWSGVRSLLQVLTFVVVVIAAVSAL